jgi:hypothetical protein
MKATPLMYIILWSFPPVYLEYTLHTSDCVATWWFAQWDLCRACGTALRPSFTRYQAKRCWQYLTYKKFVHKTRYWSRIWGLISGMSSVFILWSSAFLRHVTFGFFVLSVLQHCNKLQTDLLMQLLPINILNISLSFYLFLYERNCVFRSGLRNKVKSPSHRGSIDSVPGAGPD